MTQALDAANTATGEHHGRLAMIQVASIGQHMDQLAAHLLADNQEVARLTAAGDDAGARARMQDATDTLNACYQDSKALIPLEQEARLSYQRSLGSAKLMLTRAQESELAHHALTTFGVPESAALVASETALLAAADSGLARDYLLLGTPARGLPLAREALLLVPDSKPYHDLCVQLENTASVPH